MGTLTQILIKARDGLARQFWRGYFSPDANPNMDTSAMLPATVLVDTNLDPVDPATEGTLQKVLAALTPAAAGGAAVQCYQTVLNGASGVLVGVNTKRKGLIWQVVANVDATIAPGMTPPAQGVGNVYSAAGSWNQKSGETFLDGVVPTNAFSYVSAAPTTIIVWEFY